MTLPPQPGPKPDPKPSPTAAQVAQAAPATPATVTVADTPTEHADLPYRYQAQLIQALDLPPSAVPHMRVGSTVEGALTLTALAPIPIHQLLLRLRYMVSGSGSPEVHVVSQRALLSGPILPAPPLPPFALHERIPVRCPISYRGTYIDISWSLALVFVFSAREQWIDSIPLLVLPAVVPAARPSLPARQAVALKGVTPKVGAAQVDAPKAEADPAPTAAVEVEVALDAALSDVKVKVSCERPPLIAPDGVTVLRPSHPPSGS